MKIEWACLKHFCCLWIRECRKLNSIKIANFIGLELSCKSFSGPRHLVFLFLSNQFPCTFVANLRFYYDSSCITFESLLPYEWGKKEEKVSADKISSTFIYLFCFIFEIPSSKFTELENWGILLDWGPTTLMVRNLIGYKYSIQVVPKRKNPRVLTLL